MTRGPPSGGSDRQRSRRAEVSSIPEVLQGLLGAKLYREVTEDARAALDAAERVRTT